MKIFITRPIPQVATDILKNKGYEITQGKFKAPPTKKDLIKAVKGKGYDALLTLLTDKIDAEVLDSAGSQLKIVSNYAVGYDNISLEDAKSRNIVATNTPGNFSDCIAEHTVALIFALTTRMVEADRYARAGKYKGWDPMIFIGHDVSGKTLGIIGTGHIGERVAMHMGKGFGMTVLYYDVRRNENIEKADGSFSGAKFCSTPEEVIKQSDIVSLHVPLLPATTHLMNKERLAMMKPDAYLINTARGPVVEESALVEALKKGQLAGAGLDVFEFEPKISKSLRKMPNVVLTPHIASARESARNEMATIAAQNIIDVFEGREPRGKISK